MPKDLIKIKRTKFCKSRTKPARFGKPHGAAARRRDEERGGLAAARRGRHPSPLTFPLLLGLHLHKPTTFQRPKAFVGGCPQGKMDFLFT